MIIGVLSIVTESRYTTNKSKYKMESIFGFVQSLKWEYSILLPVSYTLISNNVIWKIEPFHDQFVYLEILSNRVFFQCKCKWRKQNNLGWTFIWNEIIIYD